jgi:acetylornithine deacetylase/succinyl-diaminopimelate desuccinylase-like protein
MLSVVELAAELVRINSVTPRAQAATDGPGETALADWLTGYLQQNDFEVERQVVAANRPNLIARSRHYKAHCPTLALAAHMDTVDTQGMTIAPFGAEIRNQALWGRGSCDDKGTLAAMITGALLWHQQQSTPNLNVVVLATMGEEMGTLGSEVLARQQLPYKAILVGEPTDLQPVIAHKGLWRLAVHSFGKAAHSSRPEEGVNAIEKLFEAQKIIVNDLKPLFEKQSDNTMNMTTLHSGSMINIIPDYGCLEIDARYVVGTDIEWHWQDWQTKLRLPCLKLKELERKPAFACQDDSALLAALEQAIHHQGMICRPQIERYYSDAGHFSAAGYDVILWGAGSISQAHTAEEHIPLDQLHRAVAMLMDLFQVFGRY